MNRKEKLFFLSQTLRIEREIFLHFYFVEIINENFFSCFSIAEIRNETFFCTSTLLRLENWRWEWRNCFLILTYLIEMFLQNPFLKEIFFSFLRKKIKFPFLFSFSKKRCLVFHCSKNLISFAIKVIYVLHVLAHWS